MKKIFTLIAVAVMALSVNAQSQSAQAIWNVSDWEEATYDADKDIDGFTIHATTTGTVTVDANSKTVDDVTYTKRVKTGGAGSFKDDVYSRVLSFEVPGNGTVSFIATSSNSNDARTVGVTFGKFIAFPSEGELPEGLNAIEVLPGNPQVKTVEYKGGPSTVYIYSKSGGVNFYLFKFTLDGSSAITDINVDNANAPVEYFNLQGIRVENPQNGLYLRRQGSKTEKVYIK